MSDERRAVERTPIAGDLTGEVTVFQAMTIRDLSERGCQIETACQLQNDSLHEFRLSLGGTTVVVKGRVVYCQIGGLDEGTVVYRSAVEFTEPSPHAVGAIREFVAVLQAPPPAIIDAELS